MDELVEFGSTVRAAHGVSEEDVLYLSELIVETEAFSQFIHGIVQLKVMANSLRRGLDPRVVPRVIGDAAAAARHSRRRLISLAGLPPGI